MYDYRYRFLSVVDVISPFSPPNRHTTSNTTMTTQHTTTQQTPSDHTTPHRAQQHNTAQAHHKHKHKHNHKHKHISISSAGTGPLHSKWYEDSFCVMRVIRQTTIVPRSRECQGFADRESRPNELILSLSLREKKRDMTREWEKRREERYSGRERETDRETVCARRSRVCRQNAPVCAVILAQDKAQETNHEWEWWVGLGRPTQMSLRWPLVALEVGAGAHCARTAQRAEPGREVGRCVEHPRRAREGEGDARNQSRFEWGGSRHRWTSATVDRRANWGVRLNSGKRLSTMSCRWSRW